MLARAFRARLYIEHDVDQFVQRTRKARVGDGIAHLAPLVAPSATRMR